VIGGISFGGQGETEYSALLMDGKKMGHTVHSRTVVGGKVTTTEKVSMTIARAGFSMTVTTAETTIETVGGKPLGFKSVQEISQMVQTVEGKFDGKGKVDISTSAMGQVQRKSADVPAGAIMSEGIRLLQLEKGLKEGTVYTAMIFSPSLQAAVPAEVRVGAKVDVDLFGRVVKLTKVEVVMQTAAGAITSVSYVDDEMKALKTIVPAMGMKLEMVACDKAFALSENDVVDFIDAMLLKSPVPLKGIESKSAATYLLKPTKEAKLSFPTTASQVVKRAENGSVALVVKPAKPSSGGSFPYKGEDAELKKSLEPTAYLQSDNQAIQILALKATQGAKSALEGAKQIESFVADYIDEKNFSIGYATALEVADSKQGDCSEHAVLVAALCRASGIPSKVVCGIVDAESFAGKSDVFGPHAWAQAYVDDTWIGLDATKVATGGFGVGHIALAVGNGDPADMFAIANTLGYFKIEKITFKD
jgi:hypothetical protein